MRKQIANSTWCCKNIDEALLLLKKGRFLEWDINTLPFTLDIKRMSYVQECIKNYGEIRFHLPHSFWDLAVNDKTVFDNSIGYYCRLFDVMQYLDAHYAILHVGAASQSDEMSALMGLEQLVPIAQKHGVKLCLETLIHGLSSDMKFIKRCLEIEGLYLCLDTGHVEVLRRERGDSVLEEIASIKDKILHAHVYDYEDENMNHVPFTAESIRKNVWLPLLQTTNCTWYTMELDCQDDQIKQKELITQILYTKN